MNRAKLYLSPRAPFTGVSSEFERSRFVFFGVPYDRTCTYKPGSRFGPAALRDVSANLELYSVRSNLDLESIPVNDLGDVDTVESLPDTLERVSTVWSEVYSDHKFPIMVGGEHSITKAPFDVLNEDIGLINFDAHLDLRDEFLGERLSHATFMRRITEKIGPNHLMEIGVRAFTKAELDFCHQSDVSLIYVKEIRKNSTEKIADKIRSFASRFKQTYVTIDIDVLDPAFAPGVGNPEPDGITTDELLSMVDASLGTNTIGLDLVEVCPPLDSGQTAAVGAKVIFEAVAALSTRRLSH